MKFEFKAKKPDGSFIEGTRESLDRFRLSHEIVSEGLIPVLIKPVSEGRKFNFEYFNQFFIRISLQEKITFSRNLGAMLAAGLSLSRSLSVLEKQTENPKFKKIIKSLLDDIEAGKSLSQALVRFPNVFSSLFVAMASAGEESGSLHESLKIVSDQLDKIYALRKKVKSALIYPIVILIAMVIIGSLMLIYVVPTIIGTFKDFDATLPLSTKIVINSSNFLVNNFLLVLFSSIFLGFLSYTAVNSAKGHRVTDYILLKLPVISEIVKQINTATTARTISSLVSSGVTLTKSLEITADVIQNYYYRNAILRAAIGIQNGESLSNLFKKEGNLFPILITEMTEVGEETGGLPKMLMSVAIFYEGEVDSLTKDISTIIEPALMLIIGAAVGFFALAMIQPIYALSGGAGI
ncbi:MAG: type II secretion system F family protein [bacterium]